MADSSITKKALAEALKELMKELPFEKISIADICERCHMNRKSFYYHFRDKYDLVNWIFDTEFVKMLAADPYEDSWQAIYDLMVYFYENRNFYRKALSVRGQNSFEGHFRELLREGVYAHLKKVIPQEQALEFYLDFLGDAIIGTVIRWLGEKDCMPPDEFFRLLRDCVVAAAERVVEDEKEFGKNEEEV